MFQDKTAFSRHIYYSLVTYQQRTQEKQQQARVTKWVYCALLTVLPPSFCLLLCIVCVFVDGGATDVWHGGGDPFLELCEMCFCVLKTLAHVSGFGHELTSNIVTVSCMGLLCKYTDRHICLTFWPWNWTFK